MGLQRNYTTFSKEWVDRLRPTIENTMVARIEFFDPATVTKALVGKKYETTYVPLAANVPCRVQPLRAAQTRQISVNTTEVQMVLVSVPIDTAVDFHIGHRARITSSPLNPDLLDYVLVLREIVDSSNPIERSLVYEVDTELRYGP